MQRIILRGVGEFGRYHFFLLNFTLELNYQGNSTDWDAVAKQKIVLQRAAMLGTDELGLLAIPDGDCDVVITC